MGTWKDYRLAVMTWAVDADDSLCPDKVWCKKQTIIGAPCANGGCTKAPCGPLRRRVYTYE